MAATVVPSVMVNLEALNHDNYEHWSFRVETYLMAEGLWDVVQGTDIAPKRKDGEAELKNNAKDGEAEFKAWQKNNAKALHAIHISCGKDAEFSIRGIKNARDAWNGLATKYKSVENLEPPGESSEVDPNDRNDSIEGDSVADVIEVRDGDQTYEPFFNNVRARHHWEDVKKFLGQHPEAARVRLPAGPTALSYAVSMEDVEGVKELLPFMEETDLKILGDALSTAINKGSDSDVMIEIIKCIVEKNERLLLRHDSTRAVPLWLALHANKPKMVHYLKSATPLEKLKSRDGAELISTGLRVNRFDISLELLQRNPRLGIARDSSGESPLYQLASTRGRLFLDELGIWERWIYYCICKPTPTPTREVSIDVHKEEKDHSAKKEEEEKDQGNQKHLIRKVACLFGELIANLRHHFGNNPMYRKKLLLDQALEIIVRMCEPLKENKLEGKPRQRELVKKALFKAVERGHAPIISHILKSDPSFCLITNGHEKTIFQLAAEYQKDSIFNLLYGFEKSDRKDIVRLKDKFGDNMLHAVGKISPLTQIGHIWGPALQMQKELQWFKKVERLASPEDLECINSDGLTPREVFTMNHRDMVEAGEKSMKETATSSSALVAALIITIMFAAAVTVPGGIKGETGIPIYLNTKAFRIFMVADVISLCSSTTSVMVFLGILTSRFAEDDFLTSLPTKLIIGILTLFLSVWAMMFAFSFAIFIMLPEKRSIVIPSFILANFPIASFVLMQFPFLHEIIISTFGSSISKRNVPKFEL